MTLLCEGPLSDMGRCEGLRVPSASYARWCAPVTSQMSISLLKSEELPQSWLVEALCCTMTRLSEYLIFSQLFLHLSPSFIIATLINIHMSFWVCAGLTPPQALCMNNTLWPRTLAPIAAPPCHRVSITRAFAAWWRMLCSACPARP